MSAYSVASCASADQLAVHRPADTQAFHPSVRKAVRNVVAACPAAVDLASSFPALLFAIATGFGNARQRERTLRLIGRGAPLRTCCETLRLPWWTRRLPACAFEEPLDALPLDATFARKICADVPTEANLARGWLWGVSYGYHAAGAEFALWAARMFVRHHATFDGPKGRETFCYLAAWAWHSQAPGTPGHRILRRPWNNTMGLKRALDEVSVWRRRIALVASLESANADGWIRNGEALGYQFVALKTPHDFIAESETMDNCLDQYSERLEAGFSSIFSVRKNGSPVADLEIGRHEHEATMPTILQLRGPRNRRASALVWRAAYVWLGSQPFRARFHDDAIVDAAMLRKTRAAFWKPYLSELKPAAVENRFSALVKLDRVRTQRMCQRRQRATPTKAKRARANTQT